MFDLFPCQQVNKEQVKLSVTKKSNEATMMDDNQFDNNNSVDNDMDCPLSEHTVSTTVAFDEALGNLPKHIFSVTTVNTWADAEDMEQMELLSVTKWSKQATMMDDDTDNEMDRRLSEYSAASAAFDEALGNLPRHIFSTSTINTWADADEISAEANILESETNYWINSSYQPNEDVPKLIVSDSPSEGHIRQ